MPELPEVETVVRELNKKLKGRTIKSVEVRVSKLIGIGPEGLGNKRQETRAKGEAFEKLLKGKRVLSVQRRAKLLIFSLAIGSKTLSASATKASPPKGESKKVLRAMEGEEELKMLVHLKMTGQFIFEDKVLKKKTGSKYRILNKLSAPLVQLPGKHTHVIFQFTDGSTLYYNDVRKFSYLKIVKADELSAVQEINEYGPEPLSRGFTLGVFLMAVKNASKKKISIKQFLMDNSVVVGIGNIYSDEILFMAKVRPERTVSSIKKQELSRIYSQIRPVLLQGIKTKGSSVGDFIRTDGTWGTMGKFHYVYGRRKQLCKLCGTIIESVKLGGRTGSFCPKCQK